MFDCANVEVRELLPELLAGTLDARTRARVDEHLASCAECASELEMMRLVRAAFAAPAIDTRKIVASLPKPPVSARRAATAPAPMKRWMDWRSAAALTMITVGGLSYAVTRQAATADLGPDTALDSAVRPVNPTQSVPVIARPDSPATRTPAQTRQAPVQMAKAQLSAGGGVADLDEDALQALLGALDEIDRAAVAPSVEPDRAPVLPVVSREGAR